MSGVCVLSISLKIVLNALGKAHDYALQPISQKSAILTNVAFKTVPVLVPLTMTFSRPSKEDRRALPLYTPLSSRRSMGLFYRLSFVTFDWLNFVTFD